MIVNIPMVCMKGAGAMARNKYPEETVARILDVSLKLFLEKGYKQTTLAEINEKAGVSFSQFQNIFRAKDGVLTELVEFMLDRKSVV